MKQTVVFATCLVGRCPCCQLLWPALKEQLPLCPPYTRPTLSVVWVAPVALPSYRVPHQPQIIPEQAVAATEYNDMSSERGAVVDTLT